MEKRLFIGFVISDDIGHQLIASARAHYGAVVDALRWTRDGNFHITSHFLGSVEQSQISVLEAGLHRVAENKPIIETTIEKIGAFPQYQSSLLAAYIKANSLILDIFNELKPVIKPVTRHTDHYGYIPHITLARGLDSLADTVKIVTNIKLNHLALYESFPDKLGSTYSPLVTVKLG